MKSSWQEKFIKSKKEQNQKKRPFSAANKTTANIDNSSRTPVKFWPYTPLWLTPPPHTGPPKGICASNPPPKTGRKNMRPNIVEVHGSVSLHYLDPETTMPLPIQLSVPFHCWEYIIQHKIGNISRKSEIPMESPLVVEFQTFYSEFNSMLGNMLKLKPF